MIVDHNNETEICPRAHCIRELPLCVQIVILDTNLGMRVFADLNNETQEFSQDYFPRKFRFAYKCEIFGNKFGHFFCHSGRSLQPVPNLFYIELIVHIIMPITYMQLETTHFASKQPVLCTKYVFVQSTKEIIEVKFKII